MAQGSTGCSVLLSDITAVRRPPYRAVAGTKVVTLPTNPQQTGVFLANMRMTVLASGSKGNSTVVSCSRTRVLVDAGLSCRELLRRMVVAGEDPAQLNAILITHEHQDHVAGLSVLARRFNIPVFFTEPTHRAWVRMVTPRTTMTYAKWLEQLQREKETRAAAVARPLRTEGAVHSRGIQYHRRHAAEAPERSDDPNPTLEFPVDPDEGTLCSGAEPAAKKLNPATFPPSSTSTPAPSSRSATSTSRPSPFRTTQLTPAASSSSPSPSAWPSPPTSAMSLPT